MSVEVLLVPLAIAAIGAWQASRTEQAADGQVVCHVATRMRDHGLLTAALADTGASTAIEDENTLVATWQGVQARFTRDQDGIWSAHLTGQVDQDRAMGIITAVDQAYGRQVQAAVLARLHERAPAAGMRVESQRVADDASVTLVLAVGSGVQA